MAEYFDSIKTWFIQYIEHVDPFVSYLALGFASYIENIFPPAPGDVITVFAASLVGAGYLSFFWVLLSSTIGSVLGFMTYYYIGKRLGKRFFLQSEWKIFSKELFLIAETWFHKHGYGIILANRFLSGARSIISIFCGFSDLDDKKVLLYASISALVWNLILIMAGQALGKNWAQIEYYMQNYFKLVLFIATIVVLFLILKGFLKRKKERKERDSNPR